MASFSELDSQPAPVVDHENLERMKRTEERFAAVASRKGLAPLDEFERPSQTVATRLAQIAFLQEAGVLTPDTRVEGAELYSVMRQEMAADDVRNAICNARRRMEIVLNGDLRKQTFFFEELFRRSR